MSRGDIEIFKLQKSIATTHEQPQLLIYNKDRSVNVQMQLSLDADKLFRRGKLKVYVHGKFKGHDFIIESFAPEQDW